MKASLVLTAGLFGAALATPVARNGGEGREGAANAGIAVPAIANHRKQNTHKFWWWPSYGNNNANQAGGTVHSTIYITLPTDANGMPIITAPVVTTDANGHTFTAVPVPATTTTSSSARLASSSTSRAAAGGVVSRSSSSTSSVGARTLVVTTRSSSTSSKVTSTSTKATSTSTKPTSTSTKVSTSTKATSTSTKATSTSTKATSTSTKPTSTSTKATSTSTKPTSTSTKPTSTSTKATSTTSKTTSTTSTTSKATSTSSSSVRSTTSSTRSTTSSSSKTSTVSSTRSSTSSRATTSTSTSTSSRTSTTSSTSTSAAATPDASYISQVLRHHNVHRTNHSAVAITWDASLAATAALIGSSCTYAHNTSANGGGYGQNIAAGVPGSNVSYIITDLFYNREVQNFAGLYGEASPDTSNLSGWGHFTQVVWNASTRVGCYTYDCSAQGLKNVGSNVPPYFTVCNYAPVGNVLGTFDKNVGRPLGESTVHWNY